VEGPERKERCRRLTADVAMKIVKLLNARRPGGAEEPDPNASGPARPEANKNGFAEEAMGKMRCDLCHEPGETVVHVGPLPVTRTQ
jgi:hypothetical protein